MDIDIIGQEKKAFEEGIFVAIPGWRKLYVTHWLPLPDKPE